MIWKKNPESKPAANEKNTEEEMRAFKTEMSASSQDGPQHGKTFPALKQGTIVTEKHIENGRKLKLEDGKIQNHENSALPPDSFFELLFE